MNHSSILPVHSGRKVPRVLGRPSGRILFFLSLTILSGLCLFPSIISLSHFMKDTLPNALPFLILQNPGLLTGREEMPEDFPGEIQAVTSEEVRRVAQTNLREDQRNLIILQPLPPV